MKFDGKKLAIEIENEVRERVVRFYCKIKIVSFLVGDDPASVLFTRLKQEAAKRVGIGFEVVRCGVGELPSQIEEWGKREEVTGVMVQLPVPELYGVNLEKIMSYIPLNKDVDGLRYPESGVLPPVVGAVFAVLEDIATVEKELWGRVFAVVGARGNVGRVIVDELNKRGVEVIAVGRERTREKLRNADVVISCVGKEGLIVAGMVKPGSIVVDVGAPKGDVTKAAYAKAKISVEVPGGVGPVTIAKLMQSACDFPRVPFPF